MESLTCQYCQHANERAATYCAACGQRLAVAVLSSQGTGVLPKGYGFELRPLTQTIGRAVTNDLVIPTNLVAAQHLRLRYADQGFIAEDLAGYGDCRLNEEPLRSPTRLTDGDLLELGSERLRFRTLLAHSAPSGEARELQHFLQS